MISARFGNGVNTPLPCPILLLRLREDVAHSKNRGKKCPAYGQKGTASDRGGHYFATNLKR